jgi:hypothetical protein
VRRFKFFTIDPYSKFGQHRDMRIVKLLIFISFMVNGVRVTANDQLKYWQFRQKQELAVLAKQDPPKVEPKAELSFQERSFLNDEMKSMNRNEDSISLRQAAPMRKKNKFQNKKIDYVTPKSNPFKRKRRGR